MASEAEFQTKFTKWAKYNVHEPGAYELKLVKGHSMPFDVVAEHQIAALLLVKHGKIGYKIPDTGIAQKPFDFFILKGSAQIVVMFHRRAQKEFFFVDIDDFVMEKRMSERKSLTEERARVIGRAFLLA